MFTFPTSLGIKVSNPLEIESCDRSVSQRGQSVLRALRLLRQAKAEDNSQQRKRIDALATWQIESVDPEQNACAVCLEPQTVGLTMGKSNLG